MSEMYFDFDAYMDERQAEEKPFIIKAFKEEHQIPSDIPFDLVLSMQRKEKEGNGSMEESEVENLANMIFGKETFEKWMSKGIGLRGVMVLMEKVIQMYMQKANKTMTTMNDSKQDAMPK